MDVTTSEKKLEADREWLDRVQKIVAMGIWDQYIPDNTLHWSEQTCRIFGLEPGTQPQDFDGFLKMVHPDDRETIIRKTERALASDDFPYRSVYRIRRQDSGEERVLHAEARIERDREGNPVRMAGVIHDITEAQLERDELRRKVEQAESEINELRGLLPICSRCKSIRDDQGLWRRLEEYFELRGDLEFSHGMCPKCREELYPFLGGEGEDAE
jgi:PAS domain S-box-containing protein